MSDELYKRQYQHWCEFLKTASASVEQTNIETEQFKRRLQNTYIKMMEEATEYNQKLAAVTLQEYGALLRLKDEVFKVYVDFDVRNPYGKKKSD